MRCQFMNTKQKHNKSLQEYRQRFKSAKDIMESHIGGPIIIKSTQKYHQNLRKQWRNTKWTWLTMLTQVKNQMHRKNNSSKKHPQSYAYI